MTRSGCSKLKLCSQEGKAERVLSLPGSMRSRLSSILPLNPPKTSTAAWSSTRSCAVLSGPGRSEPNCLDLPSSHPTGILYENPDARFSDCIQSCILLPLLPAWKYAFLAILKQCNLTSPPKQCHKTCAGVLLQKCKSERY